MLKGDWENAVANFGLDIRTSAPYKHDDEDPVRYLTAPSNAISQSAGTITGNQINSPIYIPNLAEIPIGLWNLQNMNKHSVTNPVYSQFLQPNSEQNSNISSSNK